MKRLTLLSLAVLTACAANPAKVPDHKLFADDEDQLAEKEKLQFAVVANLRPPLPLTDKAKGVAGVDDAIVADLRKLADKKNLDFVALIGDSVRYGSEKEWKNFDLRWREVLDGESVPTTEGYRLPAILAAGEHEYMGDNKLMGMEGAFPGYGADIGFNRVGSWLFFDVRVDKEIWRFVVVDTNRAKMGSRWNEQMYWIPKAGEGRFDRMVVFMHHPQVTLAKGVEDDPEGAPGDLLEALDDASGLMKIKAVFSGDAATTEAFLPDGKMGAAYFSAGGGGAPAVELERWGTAQEQGFGNIQLEPFFDLKLQQDFDKRAEAEAWPETVVDKAKAKGTWEGFTAAYDPDYYPLYGYWYVEVEGEALSATFRAWQPDGSFKDMYRIDYNGEGWRAGG